MTETAGRKIVARCSAILIAAALAALYFTSFVLAEDDAYSHGHGGYIHAPWILGMPLAIGLGFPASILIAKLWSRGVS
jgi:hypothetical protein